MNHEFNTLTPDQQAAVRRVVSQVQSSSEGGQKSEHLLNGDEAYAYPGGDGTNWGINSAAQSGFNTARGVWPEGQKA